MEAPRILVTPLREMPAWAVLERRLFDEIESAWPRFADRFCEPDGRLRFDRDLLPSRDGVDDFYEAFFNWPAFYALGGSDDILAAAKHHWRGVTAQLSELGMLTDEYENGYDWFHQGESLIFFYALCAADPGDPEFRARALRFAQLYTDARHGNWDPRHRIIRAPHTGARGALDGVGPEWETYSADQEHMRPYGLPLEGIPGIDAWDDLADPAKAATMGEEMQRRAQGDVAVNLAATSLVANAWLYDGDPEARAWIADYIGAWSVRAEANGGLLPDNVGPDGVVGSLQDGRWWGGHYGWNWPHGLPSVGMAAVIAAINAAFVTGDPSSLELARVPLDTVLDHAIVGSVDETPMSLRSNWMSRLGDDATVRTTLVPHRYGLEGWFDFGPMPLELPTWLWWFSRDPDDLARLRRLMTAQPEAPTAVKPFRDKAEGGHDLPWLTYLAGENPDYPARALSMALGQVARRLALVDQPAPDPSTVHIHYWQQVQPVVTEILGQLITGTPQVLYNGGLPMAAVSYEDTDRARPGLPPDVAALVTGLDGDDISLELVNTSLTERKRVRVRPGRFGERDIASVRSTGELSSAFPGPPPTYTSVPSEQTTLEFPVGAPDLVIELPPAHCASLVLTQSAQIREPRHRRVPDESSSSLERNRS
jgi:hypothetical protein